jgi:hypothetical protein
MPSPIRRWVLPPVAAASLLLLAAGTAMADSKSTVAVFNEDGTPAGATVCEFYVEFSPVPGGESGAWEVRDETGTAVDSGTYTVTADAGDRAPADGAWAIPNGTYTLLWDDEPVIDRSNSEAEVVVECEAATGTPGTPATAAPTPTFQASVGGETDVPETDVPNVTQPATSSLNQPSSPDQAAWTAVLLGIFGIAALALILTPRMRRGRR